MRQPPAPRRGYAIASLVLGILSIPTLGLLLVGAMAGAVLGVVALVKASREPAEYGGKGMAIAGIVLAGLSILMMPVFGIVAAIAIPSLLRARVSANEAAAIGDVRSVITAEAAYQEANAGYFDTLECLAAPEHCIPGFHGAATIDARLLATEKNGYRRRFQAGPRAEPTPPKASPSSLMSFAYSAVPAQRGKTGVRSFCGDSTGRICYVRDGSEPDVSRGACPADCLNF
jgi:type IV pilus assembly protein PilA